MQKPTVIEFHANCLKVLQKTLLAASPNEGCALILGESKNSESVKRKTCIIKLIWPCCNIWQPSIFNLKEPSTSQLENDLTKTSKQIRFALDPREQIVAQRWARTNNLSILGSAHSHPQGEAVPSLLDESWNFSEGLMAIVDGRGMVRTWWMAKTKNLKPEEIAHCENTVSK